MRAINNITRGVCQVGINAWKVASMPKALRDKFLFLWTGGYSGNDLKDSLGSSAVISVTGKDWTTRYIPQNTSATFSVPDNATFLSADGDNFWFDTLDVRQQKTHADLIASTTMRTFVKYADFEPYNIYAIGILKAGEVITDNDKITLNKFFKLWAEYWGELMDSGYMKDNRGGDSEMITNGNFNDGGTAWEPPMNDVTISDGRVNYDNSKGRSGFIKQTAANMVSAIEASTDYILEFDVIISSGNANIWIGNTSLTTGYTTPTRSDYPNGHISIEFKTPSNIGIGGFAMYFHTDSTTSFSIDNISLKLK